MKGDKVRKVFSLIAAVGLLSILLYSVFYITKITPSLAIPPIGPTSPPPTTPAPSPSFSPTPSPSPPITGQLDIRTIPQDDELRQTGTMILCSTPTSCSGLPPFTADQQQKLVAEFKIEFALNGENVDPDSLTCIVVQKEVCFVPKGAKESPRQFIQEAEGTNTFNISPDFVCKYRKTPSNPASTETPKPGVGVLDVYFVGTIDPVFIGDHILKVVATKGGVIGSEIQDICILDFPACERFGNCTVPASATTPPLVTDFRPGFTFAITLPETPPAPSIRFADPIYPFASCKTIGLWERGLDSQLVAACATGNTLRGNQDP